MNRYNSFNQIHKGLRAFMYETALTIQQTDFTDREQAQVVINLLNETVELFESHAHSEDTVVFHAIEEYEPAVVSAFEEEHQKDHALGQRLKDLVFVLTHAVAPETKIETGRTISIAFVEFMVFNLEHMAKEEAVIAKLLWRYYTDEQLHGMTQTIVSKIPPERMSKFAARMMRGLSNNEIAGWLTEVRQNAPDFVFNNLVTIAERELHRHRWIQIREQAGAVPVSAN